MSLGGERASTHTVNSARHRNNEGPPISWFGVGGVAGVLHSIVALPPIFPIPATPTLPPTYTTEEFKQTLITWYTTGIYYVDSL